jgi:LPXTG-motif cell wall-anchored protein
VQAARALGVDGAAPQTSPAARRAERSPAIPRRSGWPTIAIAGAGAAVAIALLLVIRRRRRRAI